MHTDFERVVENLPTLCLGML